MVPKDVEQLLHDEAPMVINSQSLLQVLTVSSPSISQTKFPQQFSSK
jgi:hypothetical protein